MIAGLLGLVLAGASLGSYVLYCRRRQLMRRRRESLARILEVRHCNALLIISDTIERMIISRHFIFSIISGGHR